MSKQIVRRCDVCGKIEGVDLKMIDFVTEPLQLNVNDINNNQITVSCLLNIQGNDSNNNNVTDGVVDDYNPVSYMTEEMYANENNMNIIMMDKQLEKIMKDPIKQTGNNGDICKKCFRGMVRLINDYAKFDEVVKF